MSNCILANALKDSGPHCQKRQVKLDIQHKHIQYSCVVFLFFLEHPPEMGQNHGGGLGGSILHPRCCFSASCGALASEVYLARGASGQGDITAHPSTGVPPTASPTPTSPCLESLHLEAIRA